MEYFYMWNAYRIFFYKVQVLCTYLTNVFSSMTSYFILAVSVERSFGVRTPLQLQYTWRAKKVITTMILIGKASFYCFNNSNNKTLTLLNTLRRSSDHEARNRRDLKVTFTVLAIIGCYIVTHVPSAVPFILEIFEKHSVFMSMYYQPLSNCWTLMGKVANFVLFCLSSVYFRKRLMKILKRRVIF
ncbi:hypothetical protein WR25_11194 isoform C [Diploscapter pachys]|uniref:G-protein coupled receptors family 1 profile domain-containing protein n=1 Tax=Diploscapter pachys TaxID=2018661 RepID=A0A2A2LUA7_9BILA|nr:hypothetical protein WR25_11194 isoform C [Diploscapter pachys]